MIFATTPAFTLPPYCRFLKFEEFDGLCKRAANDSLPGKPTNPAPSPVNVPSGAVYGGAGGGDYWSDGDTLLGGLHGEVALEQVGAVPTVEI